MIGIRIVVITLSYSRQVVGTELKTENAFWIIDKDPLCNLFGAIQIKTTGVNFSGQGERNVFPRHLEVTVYAVKEAVVAAKSTDLVGGEHIKPFDQCHT